MSFKANIPYGFMRFCIVRDEAQRVGSTCKRGIKFARFQLHDTNAIMRLCMVRIYIKRLLKTGHGGDQITFMTKDNTHFKIGVRKFGGALRDKLIAVECSIKIFNFKANRTDYSQSLQ